MCNTKKDFTQCSNDIGCSWCTADGIPSACHSIEDAHYMPTSVFRCTFPEVIVVPVEEETIEETEEDLLEILS